MKSKIVIKRTPQKQVKAETENALEQIFLIKES